jgi:hypothetical protein
MMTLRIEPSMYAGNYTLLEKVLVGERISTDEYGSDIYPSCEALYWNIGEWEKATKKDFWKEFNTLKAAGDGSD